MKNMKDIDKLNNLFERTMNNCLCYEREGKKMSLLNEIGCLRGIAYCLEELGVCAHENGEFLRMIKIQQDMKNSEI